MPCTCEREHCAELLEVNEPDERNRYRVERLRCSRGPNFKRVWVSA